MIIKNEEVLAELLKAYISEPTYKVLSFALFNEKLLLNKFKIVFSE